MKQTLLFQASLPIGLAVVYYVAIQFGLKTAPASVIAMSTAILAAIAVQFVIRTPGVVVFNTAAAALAVLSGGIAPAATYFAILFAVPAVMCAMIAAWFTTEEKLHPRSSIKLLAIHNILWAGAIGLAVYFGVTSYGDSMFTAAVILPLALLAYESGPKTESADAETPVSG